ncbi:MAG: Uma2 family endonuclease, partial [Gemmatimonadetes bacterium]|nr:Uma2 family endonuclease [Gemmatimonadota bacterium]
MSTITYPTVTPEEYLVRERAAAYKSEYWDGEIVAMAGAPESHDIITGNVFAALHAALHAALRGSGCRTHTSDMRVQFDASQKTVYPDVTVACGERRFLDHRRDVLLNPTFVKDGYRLIPSLREYLFVVQKEPRVELYRRESDGSWSCTLFQRMEDEVRLESIGCTLP